MNPFTAAIESTRLRNKQHATSDFESGALAVLSLAEQLDSDNFTGTDFYSEVTRRLRDVYGLPPYFVAKLDRELFQSLRAKLERGIA